MKGRYVTVSYGFLMTSVLADFFNGEIDFDEAFGILW
jgi:hypothetical protein